jgi:hypothetical protein
MKDLNSEKINEKITKNKFTNLNSFLSTSFTINSTYENINQISKFEYDKNSELREKAKNFIIEQINKMKEDTFKIQNNIKYNKKLSNSKYNSKIKYRSAYDEIPEIKLNDKKFNIILSIINEQKNS